MVGSTHGTYGPSVFAWCASMYNSSWFVDRVLVCARDLSCPFSMSTPDFLLVQAQDHSVASCCTDMHYGWFNVRYDHSVGCVVPIGTTVGPTDGMVALYK